MKFGGASLESAQNMQCIIGHIRRELPRRPVLVFSAIGKTTRALLDAARFSAAGESSRMKTLWETIAGQHRSLWSAMHLSQDRENIRTKLEQTLSLALEALLSLQQNGKLDPQEQDHILAHGELLGTRLMTAVLQDAGIQAQWLDARRLIVTTADFTCARPLPEETVNRIQSRIGHCIDSGKVPVLQGFIGATPEGKTTTLGFEGSDYTAALVGAALEASEIQIYKTVAGIMTADPGAVQGAKTIKRISFQEAAELSYFGAKVLHPATIEPAHQKSIPIGVYDVREACVKGTVIGPEEEDGKRIKSVTGRRPLTKIVLNFAESRVIHEDLPRVYDWFDSRGLIPLVLSMEKRCMIAVFPDDAVDHRLIESLQSLGSVEVCDDKASITVVGAIGMDKGVLTAELEASLEDIGIETVSDIMSPTAMTILVDGKDAGEALNRIHRKFF